MLAKFSKDNADNGDAIKIQEKIDTIKISDSEKYKEWNDFFIAENIFTNLPTEVYYAIVAYKKFFELVEYKNSLY